jgi:SNF2 family DNA or RNA helicase
MQNFDVRRFDNQTRERLAAKVQASTDFQLPPMASWNWELCRKHRGGWVEDYWDEEAQEDRQRRIVTRPAPGCRDCAIHPRAHQRVGGMWMYLRKRALLADTMGAGKTATAGILLALLRETGELSLQRMGNGMGRAIIVPRSPALAQWQRELLRMIPDLNLTMIEGTKKQRVQQYIQPWEVLLIGPEMLNGDKDMLSKFDLSLFMTDDVDSLRNRENISAANLKRLGRKADRMVVMTGTPLQKRLKELHSVLEPLGGLQVFGTEQSFLANYERVDMVTEYRDGRPVSRRPQTVYRNLDDLKMKMKPMVLRRTAKDLTDVTLPAINAEDILLELYPAQQARYDDLKRDVLLLFKEGGTEVKHLTAMSRLTYGSQICTGLAALGEEDGPKTSVKLDWLMNALTGDLEEEKVVVFAQYKNTIRALHRRLEREGIGYATIWGEEKNKAVRQREQDRFWDDPKCKVIIGTQAMEQSLNLQISRHLVNLDMILNPARMSQLAGRIRRQGSAFKHVFVHNVLTIDTQEERILPLLEREAALASHVWDESSELFQALSPLMMMQLITGG